MNRILIFLLLLTSCKEYARMAGSSGLGYVEHYETGVEDLEIIDWKVGPGIKKIKISKGVLAKLKLPIFTDGDTMKMFNGEGINSWVIKASQVQGYGRENSMGYFYAPIVRKNPRSKKISPANVQSVFVKIVYSAVAPSKRFENLTCPAFGHNKYIEDLEIISEGSSGNLEKIVITKGRKLNFKPKRAEITPIQFNGGMSLKSQFKFEIALYDSVRQRVMSNFVDIQERILVSEESEKYIKGCQGVNIPPKPEDQDRIKQFKFKR